MIVTMAIDYMDINSDYTLKRINIVKASKYGSYLCYLYIYKLYYSLIINYIFLIEKSHIS